MDDDDVNLLMHVRKQLDRTEEDILEAVRRRGLPNVPDPMNGDERSAFEEGLAQCKRAVRKRVEERAFPQATALVKEYSEGLRRRYGPAIGSARTPAEVDAVRQWLASLLLDLGSLSRE
ncbi:hypothetical protein A2856_01515 [Candidatus Uhrbacteria bacterium RIFCSPHIGHO2_01_FULL_63_20]|uniref:Uncharacterized protein n=1 Tax=Candidatus Uhrbacteria bacterium RIFCSPHIGHO2_01_FULL_63_20 TaxID=1802385 RepID=A0A1F7TLB8_9BACT|nr:MAG: hypothetical protein A2856_01515 [Candidatus Uhrbacteria bacterium RIFCSPHIGHO2_01_FULL_63_20]